MFNALTGIAIGILVLTQQPQGAMSTQELPPPPGMDSAAPAAPAPPPVMREIGEPPAPADPPRQADVRVVDAEPVGDRRTQPQPEPAPAPAAAPKPAPQPQSGGGRRVAAFWFILSSP